MPGLGAETAGRRGRCLACGPRGPEAPFTPDMRDLTLEHLTRDQTRDLLRLLLARVDVLDGLPVLPPEWR